MSQTATYTQVESLRCPRCASGPGDKCWVLAGTGITTKTRILPHVERAIAYFDALENPL